MDPGLERYRSGQTGQTVNLLAIAFSGSNPLLSTISPARGHADLLHGVAAYGIRLDTTTVFVNGRARPEPSGFANQIAVLERLDAAMEFVNRNFLNLTDAFAGHLEFLPHFLQRPGFLPVEPEAQGHDFSLARRQVFEVLADFLPHRLYAKQ